MEKVLQHENPTDESLPPTNYYEQDDDAKSAPNIPFITLPVSTKNDEPHDTLNANTMAATDTFSLDKIDDRYPDEWNEHASIFSIILLTNHSFTKKIINDDTAALLPATL